MEILLRVNLRSRWFPWHTVKVKFDECGAQVIYRCQLVLTIAADGTVKMMGDQKSAKLAFDAKLHTGTNGRILDLNVTEVESGRSAAVAIERNPFDDEIVVNIVTNSDRGLIELDASSVPPEPPWLYQHRRATRRRPSSHQPQIDFKSRAAGER